MTIETAKRRVQVKQVEVHEISLADYPADPYGVGPAKFSMVKE